jgi:hypothetical protein
MRAARPNGLESMDTILPNQARTDAEPGLETRRAGLVYECNRPGPTSSAGVGG